MGASALAAKRTRACWPSIRPSPRRPGKGRHASRLCSVCFRLLVEQRQGFVRLAEWHRPTKPPNFCSRCVSVHVLRVGAAPAVACCSSPALRFPLSRPLRDETPKYPDFLSFLFLSFAPLDLPLSSSPSLCPSSLLSRSCPRASYVTRPNGMQK